MARRQSNDQAARTAAQADRRPMPASRASLVRADRLPVTEFAFDKAGAASPFGDDIRFPLPLDRLTYTHPSENAAPASH
jgi:succinate dehydrogenase / fumarate reductase iron-sulfur subunit